MQDYNNFNFREKILYIEHALRNIPDKKRNHLGCAAAVEDLVVKYIDESKRLKFLDSLLKLIVNPEESSELRGKCKLIEMALFEHFNKKNYSRYYGDAVIVQDLVAKYVSEEKRLDFLNALLSLINR